MSLMNNKNNKGEIWSPWGTPEETLIGIEKKFLYLTICSLLDRKDVSHNKRGSLKPYIVFNLRIISCDRFDRMFY